MKEIPLTRGKVALVDDEDYETLSQMKWSASPSHGSHGSFKAQGTLAGKRIFMHRLIMNPPDRWTLVDHKDGNGLNNQRSNLRLCTPQQNQQGQRRHGLKGVRFRNGKWQAYITKNLGRFDSAKEAAQAYNEAAQLLYGEFAGLNSLEGLD